jgi:DNA invertase Pin-like site-specific DNA recombinase
MQQQGPRPITYFLYRRKSTDEPDRQILSLESQETEAVKRFGNLNIISLPPESVSAFKPDKRPVFHEMMKRVKNGEAQGIIAWHPDRLSRNAMDAAQIIYLLDLGKLRDLKFCSYTFDNSPEGKMMLQIVMSQSKYTSDKLSTDVKRGLHNKAHVGWRPGLAPPGYLNDKHGLKGEKRIYKDPDRFALVKRVWQLMLTGNYPAREVLRIATDEWKFRLPPTKRRTERKMYLSGFCRMLGNPFYYGYFEYPEGSGNWIRGRHEPMITEDEFDRVQVLLGRPNRPRPKTHHFAFTGLMKCGCGAAITAEERVKLQKNGNTHRYVYYRCTRSMNPSCKEKAIEVKELTRQVDEIISTVTISEAFTTWAIRYLHEIRKDQASAQEQTIISRQRQYERTIRQLDSLVLRYTSPENADGALITDQEYARVRSTLQKEKHRLEDESSNQGAKIDQWVELSEQTFHLARYARLWFAKGDSDTQRAILACLGSNLVVRDKMLSIQLKKPFQIITEGLKRGRVELERIEPVKKGQNSREFGKSVAANPILSRIVDDVRTCFETTREQFFIPRFDCPTS